MVFAANCTLVLRAPFLVLRAEAEVELETFCLPKNRRVASYQASENEKPLELEVHNEVQSVTLPESCRCALCSVCHPPRPVTVNYAPPLVLFQ